MILYSKGNLHVHKTKRIDTLKGILFCFACFQLYTWNKIPGLFLMWRKCPFVSHMEYIPPDQQKKCCSKTSSVGNSQKLFYSLYKTKNSVNNVIIKSKWYPNLITLPQQNSKALTRPVEWWILLLPATFIQQTRALPKFHYYMADVRTSYFLLCHQQD